MPTNDSGAQWDAKFKGFLKKAGEDFKRTAGDVKKEAERLMKEAQDPERQAKVREGVQEASVWARKTAEQLASLVEVGVKQAEGALSEVARQLKTTATKPVDDAASTPAPAPTPKNAAPPEMETAPAPAPEPKAATKKTVGRGTGVKKASAGKAATKKKSMGKKKPVATEE
ncbi:MAG: transcriptional regulator [Archangiaceae bacterium]|nr:transcriptional regulator [Archangiaceae bacterium]